MLLMEILCIDLVFLKQDEGRFMSKCKINE